MCLPCSAGSHSWQCGPSTLQQHAAAGSSCCCKPQLHKLLLNYREGNDTFVMVLVLLLLLFLLLLLLLLHMARVRLLETSFS